jgi:hypothetical protein
MKLSETHRALLSQGLAHRNFIALRTPDRDVDYPAFAHRVESLRELVMWGYATWRGTGLLEDYTQSGRYTAADAILTDAGVAEAEKRGRS